MDIIKSKKIKNGFTINIYYDDDSRYYIKEHFNDNDIRFISNHREYSDINTNDNIKDNVEYFKVKVYAYIHGSITLSRSSFSCVFDSGMFGTLLVRKEYLDDNKKLDKFILTWNELLNGECYQAEIVKNVTCNLGHEHTEFLDGCTGLYGKGNVDDIINMFMGYKN